jgi:hypothetical protein
MRLRIYLAIVACGACVSLFSAGALYCFGQRFGATDLPEKLAEMQAKQPGSVVLPFDLRYNLAFKIRRLENERPEIAWFATSRAGSASADMFKPYTFYNMAFTGWTTGQLAEAFERSTRVVRPRLVILSIDYFLFTDRWEGQLRTSRQMIINEPLRYLKSSLGSFIRSAWTNWPEFEAYEQSPSNFIGPQTILTHEGFRQDGSWLFTEAHIQSAQRQYRNVEFLVNAIPGGKTMSARQKGPIETIAKLAKERGIRLVAVQLPYLRAGVEFLDKSSADSEFYGVWHDFESGAAREWLQGIGIELFDLAHSRLDDDPANFIDAYHPSERGAKLAIVEIMGKGAFKERL